MLLEVLHAPGMQRAGFQAELRCDRTMANLMTLGGILSMHGWQKHMIVFSVYSGIHEMTNRMTITAMLCAALLSPARRRDDA